MATNLKPTVQYSLQKKLTIAELDASSNAHTEAKSKYYPENNYAATINRKLETEFNNQHKYAIKLQQTSQTSVLNQQLFNRQLLQKMRQTIINPISRLTESQLKPIAFNSLTLPSIIQLEKNKQTRAVQGQETHIQLVIDRDIENKECTLKEKIYGNRRELASLYKENRDINLEYRRIKFMSLFVPNALTSN